MALLMMKEWFPGEPRGSVTHQARLSGRGQGECIRDVASLCRDEQVRASIASYFHMGRLVESCGFTLLEVMVAVAIIAIALTAVLGSQSQSVSLASEAKFSTVAAFLAQSKMAEIESAGPDDLTSDAGDFGEDYPDYRWETEVNDVTLADSEKAGDYLKQIDLNVSWGENGLYQYSLRLYGFVSETG